MTSIDLFKKIINVILTPGLSPRESLNFIHGAVSRGKETLDDPSVLPAIDLILKKCNSSKYESSISYIHKVAEKVLTELNKRNAE